MWLCVGRPLRWRSSHKIKNCSEGVVQCAWRTLSKKKKCVLASVLRLACVLLCILLGGITELAGSRDEAAEASITPFVSVSQHCCCRASSRLDQHEHRLSTGLPGLHWPPNGQHSASRGHQERPQQCTWLPAGPQPSEPPTATAGAQAAATDFQGSQAGRCCSTCGGERCAGCSWWHLK